MPITWLSDHVQSAPAIPAARPSPGDGRYLLQLAVVETFVRASERASERDDSFSWVIGDNFPGTV